MRPADSASERLEAAIAALRRGEAYEDVVAQLPLEDRPLLAAATRLHRVRPGTAESLRPSFVLGLEEQLRTDLRVLRTSPGGKSGSSPKPGAPTWSVVLVSLVVAASLVFVGLRLASPTGGVPLIDQVLSELGVSGGSSDADTVQAQLDRGWRRLREARWLVESGRGDTAALEAALDAATRSFVGALAGTELGNGSLPGSRLMAEVSAAEAELARLAAIATPDEAELLEDAHDDIRGRLVGFGPVLISSPTSLPTEAQPTYDGSQVTPTATALPTDIPPTEPVPAVTTAVVAATMTAAPEVSPTADSSRPTATTDSRPTRAREEPSATATRAPPTTTARPVDPSLTPTADPARPTRDAHPVTSTVAPSIVPTQTPSVGTADPFPTPIVTPTGEPPPRLGERPGTRLGSGSPSGQW